MGAIAAGSRMDKELGPIRMISKDSTMKKSTLTRPDNITILIVQFLVVDMFFAS